MDLIYFKSMKSGNRSEQILPTVVLHSFQNILETLQNIYLLCVLVSVRAGVRHEETLTRPANQNGRF